MNPLASIPTPALLVDAPQVRRNVARVVAYAAGHGLAYRPHVKTHKSSWIGALQVEGGAAGLTCATDREAEVMRTASDDLLVAYPPVVPARLARLAALARGSRLAVALDSLESAERFSESLRAHGAGASVLVEVDAGMRRTGVATPHAAVDLARRVDALPALAFAGFAFYPGHIRSAGPESEAALSALGGLIEEVRASTVAAGLEVRVISGGSTPLLWRSHEIRGLTELRAGTCVYFDRTSVLGGVCEEGECAATILATVVSTAVAGRAVVDAGVKALGREPVRGGPGEGWAAVQGRPEVAVAALSEEHGMLDLSGSDWRPSVGEQVRLVPNHVCVAVHLFDDMHVLEAEGTVTRRPIDARGR
ncbi:MAG TPA: alanine racemase [Gemmatimonadales bacterium]|nr:alanine racemase [Gemmatimonadales bacterium]